MSYVLRRLALLIPTLFGVSLIAFGLIRLIPGNVVTTMFAREGLTPEQRQSMEHAFGLDQPLPVQFVQWLGNVLHGDLGVSMVNNRPITQDVLTRLPATLELAAAAIVLATLISIPLGMLAAVHRGGLVDLIARQLSLLGLAMARFWVGLLLMLAFAVYLRWLPSGGFAPFPEDPVRNLRLLVLPAVTLATGLAAVTTRMTRSAMLDVLGHDYIRTARAKGLSERVILYAHGFRNALIPVLTVVGLQAGELLSGAIIVETIFSWPGVGSFTFLAIQSRDYTTVQAMLLVNATLFALTNLAVDLLYATADPRIRYQ